MNTIPTHTARRTSMLSWPRLKSVQPRLLPLLLAACLGATTIAAGSALANPSNPTVVSGQATFSQQGNVFSIANTPNAIINWQSFSISQSEVVRFLQENSNSSVLNRITGQDPSVIMGALRSNGRVYLINPNGILFGAGAQVDVGGLIASTLDMTNADFQAGKNKFFAGATAGSVANDGAIKTGSGGKVYLIAPDVANNGVITSPGGDVVLAAGHTVQLADSTNPALQVVLSAPTDHAINVGQVIAQGGRIGIYGALINQRGTLNANSAVVGEAGKIILKSTRTTLLEAGSLTTATGAGGGGEVQVLGEQVGLMGDARVDVSGQNGGGTALIGGDYQGKNPDIMNAQQVFVGQDATIFADAIVGGNGGKVIVWGNQTAQAYGAISARGGALSGNGGFIETSGHLLDVAGIRVNAGAAHGTNGQWLLDPTNITITSDGPTPLSGVAAFSSLPGSSSEVYAGLLSNATADVVLQATNKIDFAFAVNNTNSAVSLTAQAGGDIIVEAALHFAGNITLSANNNGAGTATGTGVVNENVGFTAIAGGAKTIIDVNHPAVQVTTPTPTPTPAPTPATTPPPSADICTVAPNSALCQILSPPTASEPVKPVQQASNEVIKIIAASAPKTTDSSTTASTAPPPDSADSTSKTADKTDTKEVASNDKPGTKNEPTKKMYCN